jgi:hypothetical protein
MNPSIMLTSLITGNYRWGNQRKWQNVLNQLNVQVVEVFEKIVEPLLSKAES